MNLADQKYVPVEVLQEMILAGIPFIKDKENETKYADSVLDLLYAQQKIVEAATKAAIQPFKDNPVY